MKERPDWLKVRVPPSRVFTEMDDLLRGLKLNTVCEEAMCPNIGECFSRKTATFMILGNTCTRNCGFCAVAKGQPGPLDTDEPHRVAKAAKALDLTHVVVTSVTRDDLPDGGAAHFAETIRMIRDLRPEATIEVLVPDFMGRRESILTVLKAEPDIFNHNLETVPGLYHKVRPKAMYDRSLSVLRLAKEFTPHCYTKSGLMVGLGETQAEVKGVMVDLCSAGCDLITIGQYLQPSKEKLNVVEFINLEVFQEYERFGAKLGFKKVTATPLVRSSYHTGATLDTVCRNRCR